MFRYECTPCLTSPDVLPALRSCFGAVPASQFAPVVHAECLPSGSLIVWSMSSCTGSHFVHGLLCTAKWQDCEDWREGAGKGVGTRGLWGSGAHVGLLILQAHRPCYGCFCVLVGVLFIMMRSFPVGAHEEAAPFASTPSCICLASCIYMRLKTHGKHMHRARIRGRQVYANVCYFSRRRVYACYRGASKSKPVLD